MSLDVCVRQDMLCWIIKDTNERGSTIQHATQTVYGFHYI